MHALKFEVESSPHTDLWNRRKHYFYIKTFDIAIDYKSPGKYKHMQFIQGAKNNLFMQL